MIPDMHHLAGHFSCCLACYEHCHHKTLPQTTTITLLLTPDADDISDYGIGTACDVYLQTMRTYLFQKPPLNIPHFPPWDSSPACEDPASDMPASETADTADAAEASTSRPSATGPGADLPSPRGTRLPGREAMPTGSCPPVGMSFV